MKSFCYDPNGSFRALLTRVCHWRAIDYLRHRQAERLISLDDRLIELENDEALSVSDDVETAAGDDAAGVFAFFVPGDAEKVQAAVRAKVSVRTWDAFWLVAIQGWTVEGTAGTLAMTHTAVYAARARVARMLRDEGARVVDRQAGGV
jgi:DNA-directed RNA polymerase specialized sigma24 family protein